MTEKLKQTIKEEIEKLPEEKRKVLASFDWVMIAQEIGEKYLLDESDINNLQVETLLVLVGIEDLDLYAENIEREVGTSKNEAEEISKEINEKIFLPIYNALKENIKNNSRNKNPNWEQSLNFIQSGGDYSALGGDEVL